MRILFLLAVLFGLCQTVNCHAAEVGVGVGGNPTLFLTVASENQKLSVDLGVGLRVSEVEELRQVPRLESDYVDTTLVYYAVLEDHVSDLSRFVFSPSIRIRYTPGARLGIAAPYLFGSLKKSFASITNNSPDEFGTLAHAAEVQEIQESPLSWTFGLGASARVGENLQLLADVGFQASHVSGEVRTEKEVSLETPQDVEPFVYPQFTEIDSWEYSVVSRISVIYFFQDK